MSTTTTTIPKGENKECFAYASPSDGKRSKCKILKAWYKEEADRHCAGCPFFKRSI